MEYCELNMAAKAHVEEKKINCLAIQYIIHKPGGEFFILIYFIQETLHIDQSLL